MVCGCFPGRDDKCAEDSYSPDEMNYYGYILLDDYCIRSVLGLIRRRHSPCMKD